MMGMNSGDEGRDIMLKAATELLPSGELRGNPQAMCELFETICNPQPSPEWVSYGEVRLDEIASY